MSVSLKHRGLLVSMTLGVFDPVRKDKEESAEVTSRKGASDGFLSVSKRLLPKQAAEAIKRFDAATREWFAANTDPFADGLRLLDVRNYEDFIGLTPGVEGIRQKQQARAVLVDAWARDYAANVEAAKAALGDSFSEQDYLPLEQARKEFTFEFNNYPVPDSGNLILDLANEELERIDAEYKAREAQVAENASLNTMAKLADPLCRLARRVQFKEKAAEGVHALWADLKAVVDRIPRINITDDPRIVELRDLVNQEILSQHTPQELIDNETARENAQAKVKAILAKMQSYVTTPTS